VIDPLDRRRRFDEKPDVSGLALTGIARRRHAP
jgi:hypothetical protein